MISQIKDISSGYAPDADLAQLLWEQDTRELKILATMLYPLKHFSPEMAHKWVLQIPNQEIREQISINLFQHLPYAESLVVAWANSNEVALRTASYWLLARLLLSRKIDSFDFRDRLPRVLDDLLVEDVFLRNSALLVLKQVGRRSKSLSALILDRLSDFKDNADLIRKEIYENLSFEFHFFE